MQLYMVTGFLGSGKTTLLKNLIKILSDKKIYLIINEFGKESVDSTLLNQFKLAMSEINNGSLFCTCKIDKFEAELEKAITERPDIILVETSGLSDPSSIKQILDTNNFSSIQYMGCICLIDSKRFSKLYTTAPVIEKQLMISSLIIINKIDLVSGMELDNLLNTIKSINPTSSIYETSFATIKKEWLYSLNSDIDIDVNEISTSPNITLQRALITVDNFSSIHELKSFLDMIKSECYRIKGFVNIDKINYHVDGVGDSIKIQEYSGDIKSDNKIVFLAGKGMALRKAIKSACLSYEQCVKEVEF